MAIDITYDPSTNRITITGGTELAPADFDDIVTFDRAGTLKLLDGTIDADPDTFSLTKQVRPCEKLALQLDITCTARGGATCDIAGKDAWGNAITENGIDISSGSATTTKKFSEVDASGITVNGLQNGDSFDIEQGQWGIIWDFSSDNTYILDAYSYIGNGSTSTFFKDFNKVIVISQRSRDYYSDYHLFRLYNNATFQLGELIDESTKQTCNGCVIHMQRTTQMSNLFYPTQVNAVCNLYGCTILSKNLYTPRVEVFGSKYYRFWNCFLVNYALLRFGNDSDVFNTTVMGGSYSTKLYCAYSMDYGSEPVLENVRASNVTSAIRITGWGMSTIEKAVAEVITYAVYIAPSPWNGTLRLLDCEFNKWVMRCQNGIGQIVRQYSCNIHVADKNGANLSGANIVCKDKNDDTVFNVNTDAEGNIAEQKIDYQRWKDLGSGTFDEGDAEQFSPHKFIISKSGYETLTLEQITVDGFIDWHLELQDPVGACDYPAEDDVEKDVSYDSGNKIGNFEAPAEAEVKKDVGYGSQGIEFLGTLEAGFVLAGQNLEGQLEPEINLSGNLQENVNMIGVLEKPDKLAGALQKKIVMTGRLRKTDLVGEMK